MALFLSEDSNVKKHSFAYKKNKFFKNGGIQVKDSLLKHYGQNVNVIYDSEIGEVTTRRIKVLKHYGR